MLDYIWDIINDEKADKNIVDDLEFLMKQFDAGNFQPREMQVAIEALQPGDGIYDDFDEKLKNDLKKLSKKKLYDIVSQLCFMYGIAHAERERIRRDVKI